MDLLQNIHSIGVLGAGVGNGAGVATGCATHTPQETAHAANTQVAWRDNVRRCTKQGICGPTTVNSDDKVLAASQ